MKKSRNAERKREAVSAPESEVTARRVRKKPEVRADEIVTAAREILVEEGYDGLTYRAVASRTGVRMSSVQYYYPSRGDLYTAVVARTNEQWFQSAKEILESPLPPEERLHAISQWNITQCMKEETRSVLIQMLGLAQKEHPIKDRLQEGYRIYRGLFACVLGEIRSDLADDVLMAFATLFVSHLEGLTLFMDPGDAGCPSEPTIRALSQNVVDGYIHGLKAVSARATG